jgi:hypothetical protein
MFVIIKTADGYGRPWMGLLAPGEQTRVPSNPDGTCVELTIMAVCHDRQLAEQQLRELESAMSADSRW